MFTSIQEKRLFFTAGSASSGFCEENSWPSLATEQEHCWAWQPKGHCPASMTQVTVSQELPLLPNYKLLWQLPQSISRAFKKHEEAKWNRNVKKAKKGNYCTEDSAKCCLSLHISILIESWPWAAFHWNAGHGLASRGSGVHLTHSSSQGKLCPQIWAGAPPEGMSSNMEQRGGWVFGTKWSHPLLAGARKSLEWALKDTGTATAWVKSHLPPLPQLLCLINMGNGANNLL